MIPNDSGFDPVQAAYNLSRKNPAIDWEIEMLGHIKNGDFEQAKRSGLRAAKINIELSEAPEVDAAGATEHLVKAAALYEHIKEYGEAFSAYERARTRDPTPATRIVEGRRSTSPLRFFDLAQKAGKPEVGRSAIDEAAAKAQARFKDELKEAMFREALDDAQFMADIALKRGDHAQAAKWWKEAAHAGVRAGKQVREAHLEATTDRYDLARSAFEESLTCCLLAGDDALLKECFREMVDSHAKSAESKGGSTEKWDAFRPMEWLMEAGVLYTVLGEFAKARHMLDLARPLVEQFWKDQRGPTFWRNMAHLAIVSGKRPEAEEWRVKYRAEFERKERFDPEVVKPIQLEFDEEFYRMLGDEPAYRKTLIDICRNLEPGMREVFEGVDQLLEAGAYAEARKPLDELTMESRDQRIWRLLSAYVDWRAKVDAKHAKENDPKAFEDHMWHAIHPFVIPREGLKWAPVLEILGAEEDPIDLYPLPRALALIRAAQAAKAEAAPKN